VLPYSNNKVGVLIMEKNNKMLKEEKDITNIVEDYQETNPIDNNSFSKEGNNKICNWLSNAYGNLCKASLVVGTIGLIGTNYSKALEYTKGIQYNLLQKSLENPSMLNNIISYNLNSQYLDDILVAGGAAIAIVTARNIAETYNPVEKGLNLAGKGAYKGSKFIGKSSYKGLKFVGKSACNGGKYMVDGLRDLVGEVIIAPFAPKSKLRKIISTKDTYESNVMKDNERNRRKINKIQESKIKDSDKIVEDTNLNQQKIEKSNYKIQKLEEKIIQV